MPSLTQVVLTYVSELASNALARPTRMSDLASDMPQKPVVPSPGYRPSDGCGSKRVGQASARQHSSQHQKADDLRDKHIT